MLTDARNYFRNILDPMGFLEWQTAFSYDNIPSTILDNHYHMEVTGIDSQASSHQVHAFDYNLTLRIFKKGFRDESESIDAAIETSQTILCEILDPNNRLSTTIVDVVLNTINLIPIGVSNDNSVICELAFTVKLYINFV